MDAASKVFGDVPAAQAELARQEVSKISEEVKAVDDFAQWLITSMPMIIAKSRNKHPRRQWVKLPLVREMGNMYFYLGKPWEAERAETKLRESGFTVKHNAVLSSIGGPGLLPGIVYRIKVLDTEYRQRK